MAPLLPVALEAADPAAEVALPTTPPAPEDEEPVDELLLEEPPVEELPEEELPVEEEPELEPVDEAEDEPEDWLPPVTLFRMEPVSLLACVQWF